MELGTKSNSLDKFFIHLFLNGSLIVLLGCSLGVDEAVTLDISRANGIWITILLITYFILLTTLGFASHNADIVSAKQKENKHETTLSEL